MNIILRLVRLLIIIVTRNNVSRQDIYVFLSLLFHNFNVNTTVITYIRIFNIISLKGQVSAHRSSLTQPLIVHVPRQNIERSCVCVLVVHILPLSTALLLDFRIVPTVWNIFAFHFIIAFQF